MAQYIDVGQTIGMHRLHVVLTPSVPGPWTEAAKGILHVKKLSYGRYVVRFEARTGASAED